MKGDGSSREEEVRTVRGRRCGESRGRRLTDAGIQTRRYPDFCGAWQAVTTTPAGLGTPGGLKASSRHRSIDRVRKTLFPETGWAVVRQAHHSEIAETALGRLTPKEPVVGGLS